MLRKKKRIEALEKRIADLEAKLARSDEELAIQLFKIIKNQEYERFQKEFGLWSLGK